jgi:hypothetical protein
MGVRLDNWESHGRVDLGGRAWPSVLERGLPDTRCRRVARADGRPERVFREILKAGFFSRVSDAGCQTLAMGTRGSQSLPSVA